MLEIARSDLSGQIFVDHLSYDEQNDQFVAHPLSLGTAVWTSDDGVAWTRHDNVEFETDSGVYHVERIELDWPGIGLAVCPAANALWPGRRP